jgi:hypothetical protein
VSKFADPSWDTRQNVHIQRKRKDLKLTADVDKPKKNGRKRKKPTDEEREEEEEKGPQYYHDMPFEERMNLVLEACKVSHIFYIGC